MKEGSDVAADLVIADVLDQCARNFLLNDLSSDQSGKLLEATRDDVTFRLERGGARRRESAVEQVHQARVSVRRLRSVLQSYGNLFDHEWSAPFIVELSWFAAVLGEIRDLDVLRSVIEKSLWLVDDQTVRRSLSERLATRMDEAYERGSLERSTKRYALLLDEIATIATSVAFDAEAKGPAIEVLASQLKSAWSGVRRAVREASEKSSNENLHDVRIELKRLRYACEVLGLVAGRPALKVARAAEKSQSKLGIVHDEAVARAWLESIVIAEPQWKGALADIRTFHKDARKEAKRGWRASVNDVAASWEELRH